MNTLIDTRGRTSIMAKIIMSKVNFPFTLPYAMLRLILDVRACNGDELNFTADIIHELFDPCVLFRSHEIAWAFYFCLLAPGLLLSAPLPNKGALYVVITDQASRRVC